MHTLSLVVSLCSKNTIGGSVLVKTGGNFHHLGFFSNQIWRFELDMLTVDEFICPRTFGQHKSNHMEQPHPMVELSFTFGPEHQPLGPEHPVVWDPEHIWAIWARTHLGQNTLWSGILPQCHRRFVCCPQKRLLRISTTPWSRILPQALFVG